MTRTSRRRALGLLLVAITVPLTTAGCPSSSEDCDAEDRATGDVDCDDSGRKSKRRNPSRPRPRRR